MTTPDENTRQQAQQSRFEKHMKALLPEGWSYGYIGNVAPGVDDRVWYIFAPHPNRVGTTADRIGGYSTENHHQLLTIAQGIAFGRKALQDGR